MNSITDQSTEHRQQALPNIAYVTAGGAGMFCGSCMRDNALATALHQQGVPLTLIPTFTPIRVDEEDHSDRHVFLGGINVYLQQKVPWFGKLPKQLRQALNHPRLLQGLSKLALQTRSEDDGLLALSLLRGVEGHQAKEIGDLVDFLVQDIRPDMVALTNLLIAGFVPTLRERSDARVSVTLQGDDIFLDSLPAHHRSAVIDAMRSLVPKIDVFLTFTEDYKQRMAELFLIPTDRIQVLPLGIANPDRFARPRQEHPTERPVTVGYLARICPEKGFGVLVDAYLKLRQMQGTEKVRLRFGGWLGAADRAFFKEQLAKLTQSVDSEDFDHVDLPDHASKVRLFEEIDVFSVPTVYQECKGLYVLEALAAGVPVVQPNHGSFPELLASTGGGELVPPNDPTALALELHRLLTDRPLRTALGAQGQRAVAQKHTARHMADATLAVWQSVSR